MTVYMSWNGATNITTWSLAGGNSSTTSNSIPLGTFPKSGFETKVTVAYAPYLFVTALAADQSVLGNVTVFNNDILNYYVAADPIPIVNTTGGAACNATTSQTSEGQRNGIPFVFVSLLGAIFLAQQF